MVKSELLQKMCDLHSNILRKDIEKIFEIIFDELTKTLCRGDNIEIRGFGTYKVTKRKARTGRNPKNSELVQIPEKKAIKWKMSKILFNRLNKNFTDDKISDNYKNIN
jgi:integration host factor subunit beta